MKLKSCFFHRNTGRMHRPSVIGRMLMTVARQRLGIAPPPPKPRAPRGGGRAAYHRAFPEQFGE